MKLYLYLFLFKSIILVSSCEIQKNTINCGIINNRIRSYDSLTNSYSNRGMMPDLKILYKDSLVIEVIPIVNIKDSMGKRTTDTLIDHYLFIDLKRKIFCEYKNFSDTAKIIRIYSQPDSVEIRGSGGWRFYANRSLPFTEVPQKISDTVINSITYKRYLFKNYVNLNTNQTIDIKIAYFGCDKKGTMFQYDKEFSEKIGCPMIRLDALPSQNNSNPFSSEIEFIRDKLTKEELQVFEMWEANGLKNLRR